MRRSAFLTEYRVFALAVAASAVVLVFDIMAPLGVAGGVPYSAVVLMGWWFPKIRQIVWIALLSVALTIVGYFQSPEGGILWVVLVNRGLALFVITATAWVLIAGKRARKARAEIDQRFAQVLDSAVSGIISIDDRGTVLSFNKAAEEIFGYEPKEVIGRNIKMLMPDPDSARHDGYISDYIETGEAKTIGIGREVEGRRKDGSVFPLDLTISDMLLDGQRLFTGTVTDISERKKSENALLAAKDEAEFANQAKSEFLSSMSHELRTPLNAILGFTQLLNTDTEHPLSPGQVASTEEILQAGDHLMALVEQVLDLAAIESGKVSLDVKPQDPAGIISNCAAIAGNLADQKGVKFYDRTNGQPLTEISIDAMRFRQALLNLLSNAVKYNHPGGTVTLSVGGGREGFLRLTVVDSGRGIAEEKKPQIFIPFSRLGLENSDIMGTGIGLSITKELVEAMDGTIGFESTLELGSTFWMEFPIVGDASPKENSAAGPVAPPAASAPARGGAVPGGQSKYTVLCIEDNPGNLKLLEAIIQRIPDIAVISAVSGELGLEMAGIYLPDVIMMDINLPGMDGFEALKRLQSSAATRDIPVIALTARASKTDKAWGKETGFRHYLTKPINLEEVTKAIRDTIES